MGELKAERENESEDKLDEGFDASPVVVDSNSANPLTVTVSENLPFLDVSPSSTMSSGGHAQFLPSFPCSGFQIGANTGTISIVALDPLTGLSSNELLIPVTVTVH